MSVKYNQITKIKVFGIGGAGCNAVNRMVEEGMQAVEFYVVNTDLQALNTSKATNKILLGKNLTGGYGAGGDPKVGRESAIEAEKEIREAMKNADMIFLAAGMGGGTGTGAAPFMAKIAKEFKALTVAIVTKPFDYEGPKRMKVALAGIEELKEHVDNLITVSNNLLMEELGNIPLVDAFKEADNVLRQGVQTVTDLIGVSSLVNLDFADVRNVMQGQGSALIGIGMAQGENKAVEAAEKAINSPLLEARIYGAKKAIVNIAGGRGVTLYDEQYAMDYIREITGPEVEIISGLAINENLGENIIVTIIATGFSDSPAYRPMKSSGGNSLVEGDENETAEGDLLDFFNKRNKG